MAPSVSCAIPRTVLSLPAMLRVAGKRCVGWHLFKMYSELKAERKERAQATKKKKAADKKAGPPSKPGEFKKPVVVVVVSRLFPTQLNKEHVIFQRLLLLGISVF